MKQPCLCSEEGTCLSQPGKRCSQSSIFSFQSGFKGSNRRTVFGILCFFSPYKRNPTVRVMLFPGGTQGHHALRADTQLSGVSVREVRGECNIFLQLEPQLSWDFLPEAQPGLIEWHQGINQSRELIAKSRRSRKTSCLAPGWGSIGLRMISQLGAVTPTTSHTSEVCCTEPHFSWLN